MGAGRRKCRFISQKKGGGKVRAKGGETAKSSPFTKGVGEKKKRSGFNKKKPSATENRHWLRENPKGKPRSKGGEKKKQPNREKLSPGQTQYGRPRRKKGKSQNDTKSYGVT